MSDNKMKQANELGDRVRAEGNGKPVEWWMCIREEVKALDDVERLQFWAIATQDATTVSGSLELGILVHRYCCDLIMAAFGMGHKQGEGFVVVDKHKHAKMRKNPDLVGHSK